MAEVASPSSSSSTECADYDAIRFDRARVVPLKIHLKRRSMASFYPVDAAINSKAPGEGPF